MAHLANHAGLEALPSTTVHICLTPVLHLQPARHTQTHTMGEACTAVRGRSRAQEHAHSACAVGMLAVGGQMSMLAEWHC